LQYRGVRPDYQWYRMVPLLTNFILALQVGPACAFSRFDPPADSD
jgi:hypothetical protein